MPAQPGPRSEPRTYLRPSPALEWETDLYTHGPGTWTQVQYCLQHPRIRRVISGGTGRVATMSFRVYGCQEVFPCFTDALDTLREIDLKAEQEGLWKCHIKNSD